MGSVPNRGPTLVAVNTTFMVAAVIANALRCYVRIHMVKGFGLDDYLMVFSTVGTPAQPHVHTSTSTSISLTQLASVPS